MIFPSQRLWFAAIGESTPPPINLYTWNMTHSILGEQYKMSGMAVALSGSGNVLFVGERDGGAFNRGLVKVYDYNSGTGDWDLRVSLDNSLTEGVCNPSAFGENISSNWDGTKVIIADHKANVNGTNFNGIVHSFDWNGSSYDLTNSFTTSSLYTGISVSISSGSTRLVTAEGADGTNTCIIRTYNLLGNDWIESFTPLVISPKLVDINVPDAIQKVRCKLSSNGLELLILQQNYYVENSNFGSTNKYDNVSVYRYTLNQPSLIWEDNNETLVITDSRRYSEIFSLTANGDNTVVVLGATASGTYMAQGSCYTEHWTGTAWISQNDLKHPLQHVYAAFFGCSVSASEDLSRLAVGAYNESKYPEPLTGDETPLEYRNGVARVFGYTLEPSNGTAPTFGTELPYTTPPQGACYCWGYGSAAGNFNYDTTYSPVEMFVLGTVKCLASNSWVFAALSTSNVVYIWGDDYFAPVIDLGSGTYPLAMPDLPEPCCQIAVNDYWCCYALSETRTRLYAIGYNEQGAFGDQSYLYTIDWVELTLPTGIKINRIESYGEFLMIIASDGSVWATGSNNQGQTGYLPYYPSGVLAEISKVSDGPYREVACGWDHTIFLKDDLSVDAAGNDNYYQIFNTVNNPITPGIHTGVITGAFSYINAGYYQSLAIKTNGTMWVCGDATNYMLGYGGDQVSQVGTDTDWTAGAIDYTSIHGIKSNGTLWGQGYANLGELGIGEGYSGYIQTMTQVGTESDWVQVSKVQNVSAGLRNTTTTERIAIQTHLVDRLCEIDPATQTQEVQVQAHFVDVLVFKE